MSNETDQTIKASTSEKSKKDLKAETLIIAVGLSLGVIVVILILGQRMGFLFAGPLIYLFSLKTLTTQDKIPSFAAVIGIALLGVWMFSAGVTTGYQPAVKTGGGKRMDGMTTGQLNGRNCTSVNLGGGQSMMQCD
ncbi:MAG: hypothetical protein GXP05_10570 [Alphaproteobacteria bacterium]|nr:hypothetical protein [Alphaproteobacteria bacterium]